MTPYRRVDTPAGGGPGTWDAIVADVEELIKLLRQLEQAERFPRKKHPIHVNELRPMVRQALADHPLTRERCEHWQAKVRSDDIDDVVAFLRKQIEVPDESWMTVRNDAIVLFGAGPAIGGMVVLAVLSLMEVGIVGLPLTVPGALGLAYLVAWAKARTGSERRVCLGRDDVWLPAAGFWLRSHRVRYDDITRVELHSYADRQLRVTFPGGVARYGHNSLDVRELAEQLETRIEATRRLAWVRRQYGHG